MSLVSCSSLLVQQLLVYTYTVVSGRVSMVEHRELHHEHGVACGAHHM